MSLPLVITNVENTTQPERIFLHAKEALNLNDYLIYDATFTDEEHQSNKGRHVYRFPTHLVAKDARIVLEIGPGPRKGNPVDLTVGTTANVKGHRHYWDRKAPIINNTGDKLTLVRIASDNIFTVPAAKK
ncbi:hypothetical protein [Hymenobacter sp. B81]|uniref:hypothetical protein n=1 Tax=Hymenobacter sp. B81 TaxID=3344878 RepID=UPI0037DD5BA5